MKRVFGLIAICFAISMAMVGCTMQPDTDDDTTPVMTLVGVDNNDGTYSYTLYNAPSKVRYLRIESESKVQATLDMTAEASEIYKSKAPSYVKAISYKVRYTNSTSWSDEYTNITW